MLRFVGWELVCEFTSTVDPVSRNWFLLRLAQGDRLFVLPVLRTLAQADARISPAASIVSFMDTRRLE